MKLSLKGQTATEYLIILAIVAIISFVISSSLGGISGVGKNGQQKANEIFWKSQDLSISSFSNSQSNGVKVILQNKLKNPITIVSFKLNNQEMLTGLGDYFKVGDKLELNLDQSFAPDCISGEAFSYDVEVQYSTEITAQVYSYTGSGKKLTGTCQE